MNEKGDQGTGKDDPFPYFVIAVSSGKKGKQLRYLMCQVVGEITPQHNLVSERDLETYLAESKVRAAALPITAWGPGPANLRES